jgi:hypothetical protein
MKIEDLEDFILNILAVIVALGLSITFIVGIIKLCIWIWSV